MARHYLTNDELRHANYKYVKREFINGRWRYWYDDPKKGKTIPKDSQGQKLAKQQYQIQQQKKAKAAVQKVKKTVEDAADKFNKAQTTSKSKMQNVAQQQIVKQQQANIKKQQAEKEAAKNINVDKAKLKAEGEAKLNAKLANKAAVERMNKDLSTKATAAAKESLKKAGETGQKLKPKSSAAAAPSAGAINKNTVSEAKKDKVKDTAANIKEYFTGEKARKELSVNAAKKGITEGNLRNLGNKYSKRYTESQLISEAQEATEAFNKSVEEYKRTFPGQIETAKEYVSNLLGDVVDNIKKKKKTK